MQVKKFEAKSMKEAIDLVKTNLGPDAIVLSTKNIRGPWGEKKGIEIVAAISENILQKKKFAESKLKKDTKEKFIASPARHQKKFIDKVFNDYQSQKKSFQPTTMPYASITDEKVNFKESSLDLSNSSSPLSPSSSQSISTLKKPPFFLKRKWIGSNTHKKIKEKSSSPSSSSSPLSSVSSASPAPPQDLVSEDLAKKFSVHELFKKSTHKAYEFLDLDFIRERLSQTGISLNHRNEIINRIKKDIPEFKLKTKNYKNYVEAYVARFFLNHIDICNHPISEKFHFFIGPSGAGKTTSLIKVVSQMMLEFKKNVAIINTDTMKIGASKSLEIFAKILNIPFIELDEIQSLEKFQKNSSSIDCFFIDSPGLNLKTIKRIKEKMSFFPKEMMKVHYVQSLLFNEENTFEIISKANVSFDDVIFSHLDESKQYGTIYNFQKMFKVPLHSFGFGENIPEDFEWATKERFVDLIFKLIDWNKK